MPPSLKILFMAAEADPFVKVGGLGDVAGSLPQALKNLWSDPHSPALPGLAAPDVRLIIPMHQVIRYQNLPMRSVAELHMKHSSGMLPVQVYETDLDGLVVYLVSSDLITNDEQIYHSDAAQDALKYTLFSLASLELTRTINWAPDIVHANDWHTGIALYGLSLRKAADRFYKHTLGILGVHNMPYLGAGAGIALAPFGLTPAYGSALPWWAQDLPLPLGLLSADQVVAVSPAYAQEILTPEFSSGLHTFLQSRAQSITGILNGLDIKRWDPSNDSALIARYSVDELELRPANKTALQKELGLPHEPDTPLLVIITRLDPQKGVDLLPSALRQCSDLPWQAVILGTGDATLEAMMKALEATFPERVRTLIRFDAKLSRRLYAAADTILIPSRYEPCGLTQMIAMRYGCVPVANATGGLQDTIQDFADFGHSTGFLFRGATSENLAAALRRALNVYAEPNAWRGLQVRGMQKDFSWGNSARQYLDLYLSMVTATRRIKTKR
jgi:starch synthase